MKTTTYVWQCDDADCPGPCRLEAPAADWAPDTCPWGYEGPDWTLIEGASKGAVEGCASRATKNEEEGGQMKP